MRLDTMENEWPDVPMWVENRLELPRCCPVSTNPQPGSWLTLRYRVRERVLEVYRLKQYVQEFVGGHPDGTRNMEAMIQKIAQECADALETEVVVVVELELMPYQQMKIRCRAKPYDLLSRLPPTLLARADDGAAVRQPAPVSEPEDTAEGDL